MRTVDLEEWSRKIKKSKIKVARANRFGQQAGFRYETIFRLSIVDTATEYWANCSIPVVQLINKEDITPLERYCYILLLFVSLGTATGALSYTCYDVFSTPPLVINEQSSDTVHTNFPAVAICSNNIIHKNALDNYTEYLFNHFKNQEREAPYSRSELKSNLLLLGNMVLFTKTELHDDFDDFLLEVHKELNISDIMFKLSPSCSLMMKRCSWRGERVQCDSLFAARITPLGFCCVFNSRYMEVDVRNKQKTLELYGTHYGLGVVITENRDDFMYRRREWYGVEMLLFEGSQYPMMGSGDVHTYPVPRNQSATLNIRVVTLEAEDGIKYFSESYRGCRVDGEGQSRCLARCLRDATLALCRCVPYTLQLAPDDQPGCSLRHLPCLNKYREKFMNMIMYSTARTDVDGMKDEIRSGTSCDKCHAQCSRDLYFAAIAYTKYQNNSMLHRDYLTKDLDLVNTSTIRLFFMTDYHRGYTLGTYSDWFEILAYLSITWVMFGGVSLLSVLELIYHCTFRWKHHITRRLRLAQLKAPSV